MYGRRNGLEVRKTHSWGSSFAASWEDEQEANVGQRGANKSTFPTGAWLWWNWDIVIKVWEGNSCLPSVKTAIAVLPGSLCSWDKKHSRSYSEVPEVTKKRAEPTTLSKFWELASKTWPCSSEPHCPVNKEKIPTGCEMPKLSFMEMPVFPERSSTSKSWKPPREWSRNTPGEGVPRRRGLVF